MYWDSWSQKIQGTSLYSLVDFINVSSCQSHVARAFWIIPVWGTLQIKLPGTYISSILMAIWLALSSTVFLPSLSFLCLWLFCRQRFVTLNIEIVSHFQAIGFDTLLYGVFLKYFFMSPGYQRFLIQYISAMWFNHWRLNHWIIDIALSFFCDFWCCVYHGSVENNSWLSIFAIFSHCQLFLWNHCCLLIVQVLKFFVLSCQWCCSQNQIV